MKFLKNFDIIYLFGIIFIIIGWYFKTAILFTDDALYYLSTVITTEFAWVFLVSGVIIIVIELAITQSKRIQQIKIWNKYNLGLVIAITYTVMFLCIGIFSPPYYSVFLLPILMMIFIVIFLSNTSSWWYIVLEVIVGLHILELILNLYEQPLITWLFTTLTIIVTLFTIFILIKGIVRIVHHESSFQYFAFVLVFIIIAILPFLLNHTYTLQLISNDVGSIPPNYVCIPNIVNEIDIFFNISKNGNVGYLCGNLDYWIITKESISNLLISLTSFLLFSTYVISRFSKESIEISVNKKP